MFATQHISKKMIATGNVVVGIDNSSLNSQL